MKSEYYLIWGNTTPGPYTLQDLSDMLLCKEILPIQQVLCQGKVVLVGELINTEPVLGLESPAFSHTLPAIGNAPRAAIKSPYTAAFPWTFSFLVEALLFVLFGLMFIHLALLYLASKVSFFSRLGTFGYENDTQQMISIAISQLYSFTAFLGIVVYILYNIIFCIWLYRVSVNVHNFGANHLRFAPVWTIGSWYIPILNFVWPYQAVLEIAHVSRNPVATDTERRPLFYIWWGYSILVFLAWLSQMVAIQHGGSHSVITNWITLPHYILTMLVVGRIRVDQENLIRRGQPVVS